MLHRCARLTLARRRRRVLSAASSSGSSAVVRRAVLPPAGSALVASGPAAAVCDALEQEAENEPLAVVFAASPPALRKALACDALGAMNVVGAVDGLAFSEADGLHVVLADFGPDVDVATFDERSGALPELGRKRLEAALDEAKAPHFLVFAGEGADEGDDEWGPLEMFRRRVDGLFGVHASCSGVAARTAPGMPTGRLVHARRRPCPGDTRNRRRRAKRLKVWDAARGAVVGLALLPATADARCADTAAELAKLAFAALCVRNQSESKAPRKLPLRRGRARGGCGPRPTARRGRRPSARLTRRWRTSTRGTAATPPRSPPRPSFT
mmetsp:Transcript_22071/g.68005  ORF Transcript_22071/g.68005 Transcript_22071/m.68005 type:complete len:326 (+) Transcript_22071:378-1355(+)